MTSESRPWYRDLFEGDYVRYWLGGEEAPLIPPERTERQVAFIIEKLGLSPGARVLDHCCGYGRHAIALSKAGFRVTGLDLSPTQLRMAHRNAANAGADVGWVEADMRDVPDRLSGEMDAVINMFTAFGYFESDEEDQRVLEAVARALKPGGKFLIDFINRESVMRRFAVQSWEQHGEAFVLRARRYDFAAGKNIEELTILEPGKPARNSGLTVRMYSLVELVRMLRLAGLAFREAWGDFDGSALTLDSRRCIVLAERTP